MAADGWGGCSLRAIRLLVLVELEALAESGGGIGLTNALGQFDGCSSCLGGLGVTADCGISGSESIEEAEIAGIGGRGMFSEADGVGGIAAGRVATGGQGPSEVIHHRRPCWLELQCDSPVGDGFRRLALGLEQDA